MNIIVCVKQVPSTETRIRINTQTGFVDLSDADWVVNPFDEYALETALRTREKLGTGTVTAVSLGPERVKSALRTCLAMGLDGAVHLNDPAFDGLDALSVGRVLAAAVKKMSHDLVLCGKQAVDDDQAAVPAAIAHFLGLPHVAAVTELNLAPEAGELTARREVEGATEVVVTRPPCLLTIGKAAYEPRYPTLKLMMAAKRKEIPVFDAAALGIDPNQLTRRLEYLEDRLPPGRKPGRVIEGEPAHAVPELVRLLREEAKVL
ncbi:MAG: electron transfer flavoprotein subunit beta/FixA family protein [candidate division WOR-3 bacterium]